MKASSQCSAEVLSLLAESTQLEIEALKSLELTGADTDGYSQHDASRRCQIRHRLWAA